MIYIQEGLKGVTIFISLTIVYNVLNILLG
jgi:hypothetical protein